MSEQKADRKVVGKCEIKIFASEIKVEIYTRGEDCIRIADEIADAVWEIIDRENPERCERNGAWSRRTEDRLLAKPER